MSSVGVHDLIARLNGLRGLLQQTTEDHESLCTTQLAALEEECSSKRISKAQLSQLVVAAMVVEWPKQELRDRCVGIFTNAWAAGKAHQDFTEFANYGTERMWQFIKHNPHKALEVLGTLLEALQC